MLELADKGFKAGSRNVQVLKKMFIIIIIIIINEYITSE